MSDLPPSPPAAPEEFRLRGRPLRVTRLSRRVLVAGASVAALAITGAVAFAMWGGHGPAPKPELFATDAKPPPDALATLPKDYAGVPKDVPQLGPPLPGDLGRPILNAQAAVGQVPGEASPTGTMAAPPNHERQQQAQQREAARSSQLFIGQNRAGAAGEGVMSVPAAAAPIETGASPAAADHRLAFLNGTADRETISSHRLEPPVSPWVLQSGAIIPAALVTGIRSDLPGQVTAQVTENVYDSPTGLMLLVPQGSRLVGTYDSQIEFGQRRVLLAWTRLILPGGRSIILDRQPAGDSQGFAGLEDGVDRHLKELGSAAVISTLLGVGTEIGSDGGDDDLVQALRRGAASAASQTGQQVVGKSLDVQPTLTIRPGFPVRVIVTRDIVLEPFRS